jgi:uncharacterized LabA/DUF88 family protein
MSNVTPLKKVERIIAYVDGFNLYFGMIEANLNDCKWLNIKTLVEALLKPEQELITVKYFTSRVSNNPEKQKRQGTYIEALESQKVEIIYGRYQVNNIECHRCGNIWREPNEKMTDVNIATQIILDAYQDRYDTAVLISGDSDLVPPIKAVHQIFTNKRIMVFFPPKRHNNSVSAVAKGSLIIGRKKLKDNQFPENISKADGFILQKPKDWI